MGVKTITKHLNERRIFTRDGGRWGIGTVHRMLTRPTYVRRHEFNKRGKAVLSAVLDRRQERSDRRREHIAELNKRAAETELRLKRLYDAIESRPSTSARSRFRQASVAIRQKLIPCSSRRIALADFLSGGDGFDFK